jgi:hemerythrin-like domain-containing protein
VPVTKAPHNPKELIMAQQAKSYTDGKGAVLGAAVAGLAVGLAASIGRKAIVQGVTAGAGNWSDGLKAEHAATLKIFDALEKTDESQVGKRKTMLMQLKHSLGKHAIEEENVVYPALREQGLTEEADHLNHDHGYVKQFLYDLTELDPSDPAWIDKLREFRGDLEEHIDEEENELFPKLVAALGDEGNAHVTAQMNKEGFKVA